jgi:hypothetical protein
VPASLLQSRDYSAALPDRKGHPKSERLSKQTGQKLKPTGRGSAGGLPPACKERRQAGGRPHNTQGRHSFRQAASHARRLSASSPKWRGAQRPGEHMRSVRMTKIPQDRKPNISSVGRPLLRKPESRRVRPVQNVSYSSAHCLAASTFGLRLYVDAWRLYGRQCPHMNVSEAEQRTKIN